MIHLRKGRKLKRTSSHRKALLRNLATALLEHKRIITTEAKAKELRPYVEKLITRAKKALIREQQGLLPSGQKVDIHNRRLVYREIRRKAVLQELFDAIAPVVENRPGGYTRVIKYGFRRGDAGRTAIVELVDWASPADGEVSIKGRKKAKPKQKVVAPKKVKEKVVEDEKVKETVQKEVAPVTESEETSAPPVAEVAEVSTESVEKVQQEEIGEKVQEETGIESSTSEIGKEKEEEKNEIAQEGEGTKVEEAPEDKGSVVEKGESTAEEIKDKIDVDNASNAAEAEQK